MEITEGMEVVDLLAIGLMGVYRGILGDGTVFATIRMNKNEIILRDKKGKH